MALIHIAGWAQPVEAGRKRILEAALDAGVPFPHSCSSGECGTCKCRLLEGEVTRERYSPEALTADEAAAGLILACRTRPVGAVRIEWLAAAAPAAAVKVEARVTRIERANHDVMLLGLRVAGGQPFDFHPGQFAKLRFGRLPERSYSMASQPGDAELSFHIRVVPGGAVGQHVAQSLAVGDAVGIHGPFGEAGWAGAEPKPLLLLAGGTGLAPMLSVLDAALQGGHAADQIHLYHGVRHMQDLYAGSALRQRAAQQGFHFVPVYAQGPAADGVRACHLHEAVAEDFPDLAAARVHVAGPPPMVDAVRKLALQRGAAPTRVHADAFHAAAPEQNAEKKSLWQRLTARAA